MTVDLLFSATPLAGPAYNLVFGETGSVSGAASLSVNGTLPGMTMQVRARDYRRVTLTGVLPGMSMAIELTYASNTQRPTICRAATPWQVPTNTRAHTGVQGRTQIAQAMPTGNDAPWTTADPMAASAAGVHAQALRGTLGIELPQTGATHLGAPTTTAGFQGGIRTFSPSREAPHQDAQRVGTQGTHLAHQDAYRDRRAVRQSLWQEALHNRHLPLQTKAGKALARNTGRAVRFQEAMRPQPGVSVIIVPPKERCYTPDPNLVFKTPWSASLGLVFICDRDTGPPTTETIVVPVRRVYMIINNATLRRVDGNISLPVFTMSLSLDVGSWTWGFSATLPGDQVSNLAPATNGAPVEVEASINGVAYRAVIESIGRTRSFGKDGLQVSGRGKTALLDAPYAPTLNFANTGDRTAQQLMGDVLTVNGVPMGWDVNFAMTDWLVPAGVFSHQGTYITAVSSIAAAAGGYIQPHPTDQALSALLLYPTPSWQWGSVTPDYELPVDVTLQEGVTWVEKPRYNRVFVSGTQAGVIGQVTLSGSDGALLAPMVTDSLITDAIPARTRGIAVLSDTGRIANVSLKLPVLAETGIIVPGKFVRYLDGSTTRTGIVRSVGVEVSMPEIWQTIGVETHVN